MADVTFDEFDSTSKANGNSSMLFFRSIVSLKDLRTLSLKDLRILSLKVPLLRILSIPIVFPFWGSSAFAAVKFFKLTLRKVIRTKRSFVLSISNSYEPNDDVVMRMVF